MKQIRKFWPRLMKGLGVVMAVAIVLSGCIKEKNEPSLDLQLLYGKQWQLVHKTVNESGQDVPETIPDCNKDDTVEFRADKTYIYHNGTLKCNPAEADESVYVDGVSAFRDPPVLRFDNIEYTIVTLTASDLKLRRTLRGNSGEVIVSYHYVVK